MRAECFTAGKTRVGKVDVRYTVHEGDADKVWRQMDRCEGAHSIIEMSFEGMLAVAGDLDRG